MRKTRRLGGRGQRGCSGATHPAPHRCAPAGASHWAAARRACTSGRQNMAGGGRDRACTAARVHACAPAVAGLGACGASSAAGAHGGRRARTNGATRAPRVLEGEGACAPERRRRDARVRGAHAPPVSGGSMCLGSSGGYHRAGLPRRHNGACGGRWRSVLRARVRCGLRSVRRGRGSRGQTASSLGSGPHTRGVHSGGGARAASVSLPQMRGWGGADRSDGWLELSGGWAYLFFFRVLAHEPRSFSPRRRPHPRIDQAAAAVPRWTYYASRSCSCALVIAACCPCASCCAVAPSIGAGGRPWTVRWRGCGRWISAATRRAFPGIRGREVPACCGDRLRGLRGGSAAVGARRPRQRAVRQLQRVTPNAPGSWRPGAPTWKRRGRMGPAS